ncbi:MAG TPA: ribosome silencing factor [bacterium]|nr:ribosome silencing factor [bacterium]
MIPAPLSKILSALEDKKGIDPLILDVRNLVSYTDYLVLCSGSSTTHVRALVSAVEDVSEDPIRVNSSADDSWWVLDQVDIVVHLFREDVRLFYDLEGLWADAAVVKSAGKK